MQGARSALIDVMRGKRSSARRSSRLGGDARRIGLAFVAAALVVYFEIEAGGFVETENFKTILLSSAPLLIVGVTSAALVISGNVDLSIGGMYGLVSVATALAARETHSPAAAAAVGLGLGLALGTFNGLLVRLLSISPLIVTLGSMSVFRGAAYVASDGSSIFDLPPSLTRFGQSFILDISVTVWIALAIFVTVSVALTRTVWGMRTYAIGGNREATRVTGVKVDRHVMGLFAINGLAVGAVSVLTVAQVGSAAGTTGLNFEFDVLTAVILGGVSFAGGAGRPIGVLIGILTIGVLNSGLIFIGLTDFYQQIFKGGVLLLALTFDQYATHRRARSNAKAPPPARTRQPHSGVRGDDDDASESDQRTPGSVVFECSGLSKRYGSVQAVEDVSLSLRRGEVVCLLGDNGAGKSSLIKMITGVTRPDDGTMSLLGQPLIASSPATARSRGLEAVFQDLALCPNLGTALNMVLGAEPRVGGLGQLSLVDFRRAEEIAKERMGRLGVQLEDYFRPVGSLSGGQRQSVAIGRAARRDVAVAILDEPTAALGVTQSKRTLNLVRNLADHGVGVLLITHDVEDVLTVADRIIVLHLGRVVFEGPVHEVTQSDIIHMMAGYVSEQPDETKTLAQAQDPK